MCSWNVNDLESVVQLAQIKESWEAQAGADEFEVEMARAFEGIERDMGREGSGASYRVLCQDDDCKAVLELTDTRRGAMTKLLSLYLSPDLWNAAEKVEELQEVYVMAVTYVIRLGELRARDAQHDVKIYGRDDALLSILQTIHDKWDSIGQNLDANSTVKMEGRWLRVTI